MPKNLINLPVTKKEFGDILSWLDRAYTSNDMTKDEEILGDRLWEIYKQQSNVIGEE